MTEVVQKRRQAWANRNIKFKIFKVGDWVLLYNSKLGPHLEKLKLGYIGPYQIVDDLGQGTFRLMDIYGTHVEKPVNGFRLKKFYGTPPNPTYFRDVLVLIINPSGESSGKNHGILFELMGCVKRVCFILKFLRGIAAWFCVFLTFCASVFSLRYMSLSRLNCLREQLALLSAMGKQPVRRADLPEPEFVERKGKRKHRIIKPLLIHRL